MMSLRKHIIPFLLLLTLIMGSCNRSSSGDIPDGFAWSADFPQGNATDVHLRSDGSVAFSIAPEPGGDEYLWFCFEITAGGDKPLEFVLENASGAHQTGRRWKITRPIFSADGVTWVRAARTAYGKEFGLKEIFSDPVFRFQAPFAAETLKVAYFQPYTVEDLDRFIASVRDQPGVRISTLGSSEEGRDIPLIDIAPDPSVTSPERIWVIAREHPGETPASFVCEGMVKALLGQPAGKRLRDAYRFRIVPLLNVDGAEHGYYYHNATGVNLARDWVEFRAAETRALREKLAEDVDRYDVKLVVNLHSSNDPEKGHFFLSYPRDILTGESAGLQERLFLAANGNHPQMQGRYPVDLLRLPGITGNALLRDFDVYCLYFESNYSRGADGSEVTVSSLREVGGALVQALAEVLRPE